MARAWQPVGRFSRQFLRIGVRRTTTPCSRPQLPTTSSRIFPKKFYYGLIHEAINCRVWTQFAAPRTELADIPANMTADLGEVKEADALKFEEVFDTGSDDEQIEEHQDDSDE